MEVMITSLIASKCNWIFTGTEFTKIGVLEDVNFFRFQVIAMSINRIDDIDLAKNESTILDTSMKITKLIVCPYT